MFLAGLQKQSLIDFPGRVSCVVFTSGCNFRCPYCHNPDLARGRCGQSIPVAAFIDFLTQRRNLLEGVVISGGEPTLQADLDDLCRAIGQLGLAVKLDTNGSRPDVLHRMIQNGCIDSIAMDLKTDPLDYGPPLSPEPVCDAILESIQLVMNSGLDYEFRTTCVHPFVDDTKMARMAKAISGAKRYVLQNCNPVSMLDAAYFNPGDLIVNDTQMATYRNIASTMVTSCLVR